MAFNGSLLKINGDEFPWHYIAEKTYKITPNRKQDLDPYRTETGFLIRNVVEHEPSTISFETKPLNNTELAAMMAFIESRYTIAKERKLHMMYYNPIKDDYEIGDFYLSPNLEYNIKEIDVTNNRIKYEKFTLSFVEY